MTGILYLCATPIGNLEDMTFRAVRILKEVDFIAAEDTRHTRKLLTHFDIHTPLIRYDENCREEAGEKIIERILSGENCACVSDAGIPAISDPGANLAKLAIEAGIKISPIPGANAALSALVCSGLDTAKFTFVGFLPKSAKNRREFLEKLKKCEETLIFYEAPHRLKETLNVLAGSFGNRKIVLAREITKIHEEFIRGNLEEIVQNPGEIRGEFVIVLEGAKNFPEEFSEGSSENFIDFCKNLIETGTDKKSAIRETAKRFNVGRREVYNEILKSGI